MSNLAKHLSGSNRAEKYLRDHYDARFEKMYLFITADLIAEHELPNLYPMVTPSNFKGITLQTQVYVFSMSYLCYSTNEISVMKRISAEGHAKVYEASTKEEFIALIQAYALGGDLRNLFHG